ncbi:enoyl-CoA hydratase-related protein [uncultured Massilia sp.]|uniref:enoyl-CoA hydratase-related protein n=1 Tax=uncultured Massilia sp. TaxID=169973 RepID=UPI0025E98852|nr:enoyl-CoA hydratase-related protein [uncultured Massilia sp.]
MSAPQATAPVGWSVDDDGVAVVTIDRTRRRNALNLDVKQRLTDAVLALGADERARVIVLTGAGGYFVAGTDIDEMAGMTPTSHTLQATDRVFTTLRHSAKPVIAAVEGYALGGGCELALACDMIVAAEGARFGQPEIRVGIMPGAGGTQRLLRTIGKYQALRMMLTGEPIAARDAWAFGLVSELCPDGAALERARALARTVAAMPPLAVRAIREVVQQGQDAPLETALLLERKAFQLLFDSADQREGMRAFLDKRPPRYKGS